MAVSITVVICTHNPRPAYLRQVLDGLRRQSLSTDHWEMLIVDNASQPPLSAELHPEWHPHAQVLQEPCLGKTNAVLRGIGESSGDLIVLVDDDNVIAPDYLEKARSIATRWPTLGTWGGSIEASYESPPPDWLKTYESYLSVRRIDRDRWFNLSHPGVYGLLPYGAGLCVRRQVAQEYRRKLTDDPIRRKLDRKGDSLVSSGDTDLVLLGCDLGLGTGSFKDLRLTHLIHGGRLSEAYMERMLREMTYSLVLLAALRGHSPDSDSLPHRLWGYWSALRRGMRELRFHSAAMRGVHAAKAQIRTWHSAAR